ncbi:hypothetical protein BYT27DRAFT_7112774, partial [Phlegmacium glaucopus]
MTAPSPKARQPRKQGLYTPVEKEIFGKFKEEYRSSSTRELRGQLMREKILPAIFNYWNDQGIGPMNDEEWKSRQQALATWIRNNWRPVAALTEHKSLIIVNPLNIIWKEHTEAVHKELKLMLDVMCVDWTDPRFFAQRTHACKQVLDSMSPQDRAAFDAKVEARKREGNPENTQHERAERHGDEVVRKWAHERWLDMGMLTMVFTVHSDCQGRWVVDCHEDIAKHVGRNGQSFTARYNDKVMEIKRLLLDFVKSIRTQDGQLASSVSNRTGADDHPSGSGSHSTNLVDLQSGVNAFPSPRQAIDLVDLSSGINGFPMLPQAVTGDLTKKQWEHILRSFLSQHYYLASGGLMRQVPFEQVEKNTNRFVAHEYRPEGLVIKDPRNMHKDNIVRLMRHVYQRQIRDGVERAFRFR